jgi:Na+-translocating ferredoxin:NAD+ oxidoreductase subunit D
MNSSELQLTVSSGPFLHGAGNVRRTIWMANAALIPAVAMGIASFGMHAALVIGVCAVTAVLSEFCYQWIMKKPVTATDGSALLTGMLLSLNLPPAIPLHLSALGAFVAIVAAKQLFGGLGYTVFNPALIGRAFLQVSFPSAMSTWSAPIWAAGRIDGLTAATPLTVLKHEGAVRVTEIFGSIPQVYWEMLTGNRGGCIGENALPALLLGGVLLLALRCVSWHIPVSFIGSAALMAWIFGSNGGFLTGDPLLHILSGGIVLGAFFMATDHVTSPVKKRGQLIFGAGCGILTMIIRLWGSFPEGVMFAILTMNGFTPLIDRAVRPRTFGTKQEVRHAQ